jgi:predicted NUDIX family NTP pyrophosphohydrolase
MKQSSGTLLYRQGPSGLEVLLVHPSGVYNRRSPWGIPKGMIDGEETPEQAARRETMEETGVVAGELVDLGHVDYTRSKKRVHCFAGLAPEDAEACCASWEVDQVVWVPLDRARSLMHPDQALFIDRLVELLARKD